MKWPLVDGTLTAAPGKSVLFEVFDPPWWRLDRWFSWWFFARKAERGTVVMRLLVGGAMREREVRIRARKVVHAVLPGNGPTIH